MPFIDTSTAQAHVREIKVLTTGILKGAFDRLATRFQADTGHRLAMSWGPSTGTSAEASPVRVRSGEAIDVLIMVPVRRQAQTMQQTLQRVPREQQFHGLAARMRQVQ